MSVSQSPVTTAQERVTERLDDPERVSEQQAAVCRHEGAAFIAACPGSGKTQTVGTRLAYRAAFAPDESVAAMSHTNTAVEEIRRAATGLFFVPDHYFIGTLHTFLLRYIVYPFGHLIMECSVTPRVVAEHVDWERTGLPSIGACGDMRYRVRPWLFDILLMENGELELAYRPPGAWPAALTSDAIAGAHAKWGVDQKEAYWKQGLLSYADVPFLAYAVLDNYQSVAGALSARFDELIVDEVQDASRLQLACLRLLRDHATRPNLVIVGDLCQSIYEWSDATPEGVRTFAEAQGLSELPLTANFRSSRRICAVTHRFSTRADPDVAGEPPDHTASPPELWTYKRNHEPQLTQRFLQRLETDGIAEQDAAILGRVHAVVNRLNSRSSTSTPMHWLLRTLGSAAVERDDGVGPTREKFRRLDRAVNFVAFGDAQPANPSQRQREAVRLASGDILDQLPSVTGDLPSWNLLSRDILAAVAATVPGASVQNVKNYMKAANVFSGKDARGELAPPPVKLARTIHDAKGETIQAVLVVARKEDAEQWANEAWLDNPPRPRQRRSPGRLCGVYACSPIAHPRRARHHILRDDAEAIQRGLCRALKTCGWPDSGRSQELNLAFRLKAGLAESKVRRRRGRRAHGCSVPTLLIGRRRTELRKLHLKPHEAAFVLRRSEVDVRNKLRRGERLAAKGATADEIVGSGALPVSYAGTRARRADITGVVARLGDDLLALEMLAAIVERRIDAPRAVTPDALAPDLLDRVGRL